MFDKYQVLSMLRKGKAKAITGKELARRLGEPNDRAIRLVIRELIADGYAIASSVNKPHGYYLVETQEEAKEYMAGLKSRLINDALRRRDFKRAVQVKVEPRQLSLV